MRRTAIYVVCAAAAAAWLGACKAPLWDVAPTTMFYIDPIVSDDTLSPQEKRARLEQLGLSPQVINALLKDERLGNQFGGDLRTAYEKVVADTLTKLTPDEVQAYGDGVAAVSPISVNWEDKIAQMIVDIFRDNNLQARVDLAAWLDDPANVATLPAKLTPDDLIDVFVVFDTELLLEILP